MRSRWATAGGIAVAVVPLWVFWIAAHRPRLPDPQPVRHGTRILPPLPASAVPRATAGRRFQVLAEVLEVDGRPVRGTPVTLVDADGRGDVLVEGRPRELKDRDAITDERGRAPFDDLPPGRYLLIARPPARPAAWGAPFVLTASTHEVLTIPPPVTLTGLTHPRAQLTITSRVPGLPHAGHQPVTSAATADDAGGYQVDGLPPSAAFTVLVEAPGYKGRSFGPYRFPPGRHLVDFDLNTGLQLRGTVRDGAGRPVPGARVTFDDARTVTDADGTFTLAGLEERTTTLIVAREGYLRSVRTSVRPGSVDVTLARSAEVSGRIAGGRGRYVCFSVGDARYRLGLGDSEQFRLPSVPPGPLRLDVEDDERRVLGTATVDAPEGGSVEDVRIVVE